jgi:hypothetical protein
MTFDSHSLPKMKSLLFRKLFFLVLVGVALHGRAQGSREFGFYAEHFQLGFRSQQAFGGEFHFPLGDRATLNYKLAIGPQQGGGFYVHAPVGLVVGSYLLTHPSEYDIVSTVGLLCLAIPEGVGVYVSDGKLKTHVSFNPFGYEYFYHKDPDYEEYGRMSCSLVLRFKMSSGLKFPSYIAPEIGGSMIYRSDRDEFSPFGFFVGVTIGFEKTTTDGGQ